MESSARKPPRYRCSDEKYFSAVILPSIRGKTCSICLTALHDHRRAAVISACLHAYCLSCLRRWSEVKRRCPLCNVAFDSWYCRISLSYRMFVTEKLPAPAPVKSKVTPLPIPRPRFLPRQALRTYRTTESLPRRRAFSCGEDRVRWRASIFNQWLRAVPIADLTAGPKSADGILQRIEPWIRRELLAILEDPDPSVIVHVVASLFIASVEPKCHLQSGRIGIADDFLGPIRPFLRDWTEMFWHELRCFAASSLNMETYDEVVNYVPSEEFDEATPPPRTLPRG